MTTLWQLSVAGRAVVSCISNDLPKAYQTRIQDFGFLPGQPVECLRHTPFNGPRLFQLGDSILSLDQATAEGILILIEPATK